MSRAGTEWMLLTRCPSVGHAELLVAALGKAGLGAEIRGRHLGRQPAGTRARIGRVRRPILAVISLIAACASRGGAPETLDLVLEHGDVVDGTGAPRMHANVGVRGEQIVAVGDLTKAPARRRIDVSGRGHARLH
jgi:hypothetical protein